MLNVLSARTGARSATPVRKIENFISLRYTVMTEREGITKQERNLCMNLGAAVTPLRHLIDR
jgi:hypothetical protein